LFISDSPFYLDISSMMSKSVKEDVNPSWITKKFIKTDKPTLEEVKKQDPEESKRVQLLQQELFEQKMISTALRRQMAELKEQHRASEEAQARRSEALEETVKKQPEDLKAMMTDMMAMMKQQQKP